MINTLNQGDRYQGQLKASSVEGGYFKKNINYFNEIKNSCKNNDLSYISRIAIFWDRPGNKIYKNKQTEQYETHPKPFVYFTDKNSNSPHQFEISQNYILQLRDVQITGISFSEDSSPKCFIDYIGYPTAISS